MNDVPGNGPRLPRPVRRGYTPIVQKRASPHAFERAMKIRVLVFSPVGAFLGFLLGGFATVNGAGGGLVIILATLMGWAAAYFGPLALAAASGRAAGTVYAPSGRSTPRKKEYSLAESYVARGDYEGALEVFEVAILEDPDEPTPYLRVARIRRDLMGDPHGAADGFKRALTSATMDSGVRLLALKEMVELCEVRLGEPRRAAPLLARVAEQHATSPEGVWAAEELVRIRRRMADEGETD